MQEDHPVRRLLPSVVSVMNRLGLGLTDTPDAQAMHTASEALRGAVSCRVPTPSMERYNQFIFAGVSQQRKAGPCSDWDSLVLRVELSAQYLEVVGKEQTTRDGKDGVRQVMVYNVHHQTKHFITMRAGALGDAVQSAYMDWNAPEWVVHTVEGSKAHKVVNDHERSELEMLTSLSGAFTAEYGGTTPTGPQFLGHMCVIGYHSSVPVSVFAASPSGNQCIHRAFVTPEEAERVEETGDNFMWKPRAVVINVPHDSGEGPIDDSVFVQYQTPGELECEWGRCVMERTPGIHCYNTATTAAPPSTVDHELFDFLHDCAPL